MTTEAICSTWLHLNKEDKSKIGHSPPAGISSSYVTDKSGHGPHNPQCSFSTSEQGHTALFGWRTSLVIISHRGKAQDLSNWYYASWEDPPLTTAELLLTWKTDSLRHIQENIYVDTSKESQSKSQSQFLGFVFWVGWQELMVYRLDCL